MIETVVDWLRDELSVPVFAYEIPKETELPARAITLARSPGGTPPRGSFRRDSLNVWVYGEDLKDAEALYQECAEALKNVRRIVPKIAGDSGGLVISLDEEGSPAPNIDDRTRDPHMWAPWSMLVSR